MTAGTVLVLGCSLVIVASLAGGWLPLLIQLTHERMQLAVSFVAGAMLGVGLLHLLPHEVGELGSVDRAVLWALFGFLAMFFVERFFAFHHHDVPVDHSHEGCDAHDHDHDHDHAHSHAHGHAHRHTPEPAADLPVHAMSWWGAAIGMTLHSLADGVALAASIDSEWSPGAGMTAGLATFLVIFLHKPFDSLTIGTLMAAGGRSRRSRHLVNLLFALMIPVGALLFHVGFTQFDNGGRDVLGYALAFSAGTFICIATSDLLPELQFHSHDRIKLSAALLAGLAVSWVIGYFEHGGHGHHHDHGVTHEHSVHGHDHEHAGESVPH